MVEYRFYEDIDFDLIDGSIILDLNNDIDGERHNTVIICDNKSILVEIEHNEINGFGDQITLYESDVLEDGKVRRIRLTANENNSAYRVIGGITS